MKKALLNTSLVMISIGFTLVVFEFASRLLLPQAQTRVIDKAGRTTSMQIEPGNPSAGLEPHFEGRMISNEFNVSIFLDSLGFRKSRRSKGIQDETALHVMLLGDSFMFGWGVEFYESFGVILAKQLEKQLSKRVVLYPFAIPGTGQLSQLKIAKRFASLNPDIVIVGMYIANHPASGNDLIDNLNENHRFQIDTGEQTEEVAEIPKSNFAHRVNRWLISSSNLYRLIRFKAGSILLAKYSDAINFGSDPRIMQRGWAVTDSVLSILHKTVANREGIMIIQYIPHMLDVANRNQTVFSKLQKLCTSQRILLSSNPIELFRVSGTEEQFDIRKFYFILDGHWTAKAHQESARETAQIIAEHISGSKP